MEAVTEDDDHRRQSSRDNDDVKEEQRVGKMKNNGRKNEKTMLRTPTDIYEHTSFYSFILDMPGLDALNIKVKVENGILHVTGKKRKQQMGSIPSATTTTTATKDEGEVKVIRIERRRARYMRKFSLAEDATHENVKATYKDGVLSIIVPKTTSFHNSIPTTLTNVSIS